MAEGSPAAIRLDSVVKRYGAHDVVRDVSFEVPAGQLVALVGHNGAGKTTLMKLMLGLTRPNAGEIRIEGADPAGPAAVTLRRAIGYLPENVAFQGAMTGRELLTFYARLKDQPAASCGDLLDTVGLTESADRPVRTYSKGMRQRLGLAQALLGQPRLLFFDEPTSGLDPSARLRFYDLLTRLRASGATVLVSSHALTEIEARADRIAIMKTGRLVALGALEALRQEADLPVRMTLSVQPGQAAAVADRIGAAADLRKVNETVVDLNCLGRDKMEIVRRISDLGETVRDVEIAPPNLEQIYAHFTGDARPQ